MSTDRETTRIVRSWLLEGVTSLPDRVLDDVLDQLPEAHQRRARWWPAKWPLHINKAVAWSVVAAAVAFIALLGISVLAPAGPTFGDAGERPTATSAASPMPWPAVEGADLTPGTYRADIPEPIHSIITVPEGWNACGMRGGEITACAGRTESGAVDVLIVANVVRDPCDRSRALLDPPVGSSVDDLVAALSNLSGFEVTDPVDITLDGFPGKEMALTAPTAPDCTLDGTGLGTWTRQGRPGTNGVGPGEVNLLRILDVDGVRVVIAGAYQSDASASEIGEVRAVFESARVTP